VENETLDPRLLSRLPQRDQLAARLTRVGVAARLQPTVELAVVEQQDPVT
jgi:hypothetical protein